MRLYYAHCIAIYNTPQEARDVVTLEALGFEVVNPNSPTTQEQCDRIRNGPECKHKTPMPSCGHCYVHPWPGQDIGHTIMHHVFKPLVRSCDALAFRALPDGRIPAGVGLEIQWATKESKPVFELAWSLNRRTISIAETKEYLAEVGQR